MSIETPNNSKTFNIEIKFCSLTGAGHLDMLVWKEDTSEKDSLEELMDCLCTAPPPSTSLTGIHCSALCTVNCNMDALCTRHALHLQGVAVQLKAAASVQCISTEQLLALGADALVAVLGSGRGCI